MEQNTDKSLLEEIRKAAHTTVERMDFAAAYDCFSLDTVKMDAARYAVWMRPSSEAMAKMGDNAISIQDRLYDVADSSKWKYFFPIPSPFGVGHAITQEEADRLYLADCNVSILTTGGRFFLVPNREGCTEWDVMRAYVMLGRLPYAMFPLGSRLPDIHSIENAILVEARIKALKLAKESIEEQIDQLTNLYNAD